MKTYDPNELMGMTTQTVRLTFQVWEHQVDKVVSVGGNCSGFSVIESAVCNLFDKLDTQNRLGDLVPFIDINGCTCFDEDEREEEWLKDMLVSAAIVEVQATPPFAEGAKN